MCAKHFALSGMPFEFTPMRPLNERIGVRAVLVALASGAGNAEKITLGMARRAAKERDEFLVAARAAGDGSRTLTVVAKGRRPAAALATLCLAGGLVVYGWPPARQPLGTANHGAPQAAALPVTENPERHLGSDAQLPRLITANPQRPNINLIYPGDVVVLPSGKRRPRGQRT